MSIEVDSEIYQTRTAAEPIPLDERHLLLANPYRRLALSVMEDGPTSLSLEELSERIAGIDDTDSISTDFEEIALLMHHCHLPKLDGYDLLRYDADARTVSRV